MVFEAAVQIQEYQNAAAILILISILLILINCSFTQSVLGKIHREKYIAFNTASGQISIALAAVEDLIKRLTLQVPEVKNLRPDVRARRRGGIVVYLRIDLKSETNIVDLTERLQELVKSKIQDMLRGIDEPIIVKIHVAKIVAQEEKDKKKTDSEPKEQPTIPFYGYGR
jgi:uncharacterized alkaline shock family protein YloU